MLCFVWHIVALFGFVGGLLNLIHQTFVCIGRHILVKVVNRVYVGAVVYHLIMQVGRCGLSRITHIGNELSALDCVALRYV